MEILKLSIHQFAVGKGEHETGIVLNNDDTIYHTGDDENKRYEVFNNFDIAKEFVILKVSNNPKIECWIENSKRETIFTFDRNGERNIISK